MLKGGFLPSLAVAGLVLSLGRNLPFILCSLTPALLAISLVYLSLWNLGLFSEV